MKCDNCNNPAPAIYRVNPPGKQGVRWCEGCLARIEPELYRNTMEDFGDIVGILTEFCNSQTEKKRWEQKP